MALDDRQHVEAVALLRDLLEQPGVVIASSLRQDVEAWLRGNEPPAGARFRATRQPLTVTSMAAARDPDSNAVIVTLTSGVQDAARDWPFKLHETDSDALGCALRSLRNRGGKDTDRMREERDSLSQALVILGAEPCS